MYVCMYMDKQRCECNTGGGGEAAGVDGEVDGRASPRHSYQRGGGRSGPGGRGRGSMDRNHGGPMMRGRFVTYFFINQSKRRFI